jgi:hypothetical protein
MWGIGLKRYDIKILSGIADDFEAFMNKYPDLKSAAITLENFGMQGVAAVEDSATAYPHRDIVYHMFAPYIILLI